MSKNNEKGLEPKLRFPEFQCKEGWKKKYLEDVCTINPKVSTLPDEFIYVDLESVEKGNLHQKKTIKKEEAPSRAQRLLSDNDIAFQMVRPYQMNNYYFTRNDDNLYVASTGYAQLRAFESSGFLYQLIHTDRFVSNVLKKCTGSNYPAISSSDLSLIAIEIPSTLEEQQKIASCLLSLDDVITAESQKLEVLKEHKKGLLQNLFPQEGETVPKFRFKEFEDSGEWAKKELGEIADFLKGKGISKADVVDDGIQPCIRYGELYTHYGEVITEIKSFTNQYEELMLSESNDVIIPSSGETKEDIATASCVKLDGVALGGDLNILRSQLNGAFLAYYLSHGLKRAISKIAQGDAVVHLYASQLKKLSIKIPLRDNEQEKIADTISSVDELIHAQTQKIEQLKEHKKGLLQGLFPSPEGAPYHNDVAQPIE